MEKNDKADPKKRFSLYDPEKLQKTSNKTIDDSVILYFSVLDCAYAKMVDERFIDHDLWFRIYMDDEKWERFHKIMDPFGALLQYTGVDPRSFESEWNRIMENPENLYALKEFVHDEENERRPPKEAKFHATFDDEWRDLFDAFSRKIHEFTGKYYAKAFDFLYKDHTGRKSFFEKICHVNDRYGNCFSSWRGLFDPEKTIENYIEPRSPKYIHGDFNSEHRYNYTPTQRELDGLHARMKENDPEMKYLGEWLEGFDLTDTEWKIKELKDYVDAQDIAFAKAHYDAFHNPANFKKYKPAPSLLELEMKDMSTPLSKAELAEEKAEHERDIARRGEDM